MQTYLLGRTGLRKAAALGTPPDRPTGHYQRKLDRHVGRDSAQRDGYILAMPGYNALELEDQIRTMFTFVPHEEVRFHFDAALRTKLRESIDNDELPVAYLENPIVLANGTRDVLFFLLNVYIVGVPYS